MILTGKAIDNRLKTPGNGRVTIRPRPPLKSAKDRAAAAIDLRLGCWIATMRRPNLEVLQAVDPGQLDKSQVPELTKQVFVPFGQRFILHPGEFVLGATLEWISLPNDLAAEVTAKSSWGRLGLIIATATGVHPGFCGCLTLELSNVGTVPIALEPGLAICQIFLQEVSQPVKLEKRSRMAGRRQPLLAPIQRDEFAAAISRGIRQKARDGAPSAVLGKLQAASNQS
jgi:dCTP deaminase